MNIKYKSLLGVAMAAPLLLATSCIEETFPTDGVTQEQLTGSAKATDALVFGMSAHMITVWSIGSVNNFHGDFGEPAMMHARDVMCEDMSVQYGGGYDWFNGWSGVTVGMDPLYKPCSFTWTFLYEQILADNQTIRAIDDEETNAALRYNLGMGYAFRAATYLEAAQMYEFLPNNNTSAPELVGLTIPIVTENTTEEESRNNPRAPHNKMVKFIKSDLEKAIDRLQNGSRPDKTLPDLAVAYGLMARLLMWDATYTENAYPHCNEEQTAAELYADAARYARLAIETSGATPLTESQWTSTTNGFNDLSVSSWMWGMQLVEESGAVKTGIINWTSFLSNEQDFGYASAGAWVMASTNFYNMMSDRDFRKQSFVPVEGSSLNNKVQYIDKDFAAENFEPLYSLKFRPGKGDRLDYKVAASVGIPLMRVEEMYLIEAEAVAHNNPQEGIALCENFVKRYRNGAYRHYAQTQEEIIEEIIAQKRIELWGEGLVYYDYKRLDMSVIRDYDGSNFEYGNNTYNTTGRPWWMNLPIPMTETRNNVALSTTNNPSVAGVMTPAN